MSNNKSNQLKPAPIAEKKKSKRKPSKVAAPRSPVFKAFRQVLRRDSLADIALYLFAIICGGFFPLCAYLSAHSGNGWLSFSSVLTAFCLAFSVPTALSFGNVAFDGYKVYGFAFGLEFAMLVSHSKTLSIVALGLLIVVNVVACYYNLSTGKKFSAQTVQA